MAKTSEKPASATEEAKAEGMETAAQVAEEQAASKKEKEIPANVLALMKLYPQYKEFYVTPDGFVHPVGAPEYLRKGATLYKNKFSNK